MPCFLVSTNSLFSEVNNYYHNGILMAFEAKFAIFLAYEDQNFDNL